MQTTLAPDEIALIKNCLEASVNGPFFPEWEFETLFGLSKVKVAEVASGWPQNVEAPDTKMAVMNALANLRGYPHGLQDELARRGCDPQAVERLLQKLSLSSE